MSEEVKPEISVQTIEAINLLKKIVKFSNIEKQKHLDLTLANSSERGEFEKALILVNLAVEQGQLSKEELNSKLGIK
ncbi:MAG: hypothetical protein H6622_13665 [Halobacteriovoraceae bacterium]|nr:hypothetical protein [Halobacteriovoraceae bacterium]